MLILTRSDVEALLTMPDTIDAVEAGFRQLAANRVEMPQRVALPIAPHNGLHLSMPAFIQGENGQREDADAPGTLSIKIITVYGDNAARFGLPMIQGIVLLYDARNGQLLAMMDAEHLTAMRTGASSGVATRYLAREDAATVALFGAGAQAGAQLEAVCAVRPIERAYVVTRSGSKDEAFCAQMRARLQIDVEPAAGPREAVQAADIICTATNSQTPVFDGEWIKPGTHINAVGAYTRTMRELDATTIARSRVYVDNHIAAQAEAGDIMLAVADGVIEYDHVIGELGQVIIGDVVRRTNDEEITLFKSVGLAMQDAMTSARVYALATARGIGQAVELS